MPRHAKKCDKIISKNTSREWRDGRILRVGGIKEKVLAASRSGIKEVILPDQNRNDWLEVPIEVRSKMKVHFVKNISQLIPLALSAK